jgi:hypothetical protein
MEQKVFVFGNPDLPEDSLPLRMLPELKKRLPEADFCVFDPNEDWPDTVEMVILDTVQGIETVTMFKSLDEFLPAPRLTMHDFDAYANLKLLEKLGKVKRVFIIGVPFRATGENISESVVRMLLEIGFSAQK